MENIDKAMLALIIIGIVLVTELGLIGFLGYLGIQIPEQAWSLVYASLGLLAGAAGAQVWNGKLKE